MTENAIRGGQGSRTEVGRYVGGRVARLQARMLAGGDGPTRAALAKLRRGVGQPIAADPELWGVVFDGFPSAWLGRDDLPSRSEEATFAAMTLFAVHQQSKSEPMHVPGRGLGDAVRRLASPENAEELSRPVLRRFNALATADSFEEVLHHARGLVQQLRAESIGLDYGILAEDLAALQDPRKADSVRLRWARAFHRRQHDPTAQPSSSSSPN